MKPQRPFHFSAACNAFPSASVSCRRFGRRVSVSNLAICEILSADSRCWVISDPTPRKPWNMPLSSSFGEADNSHQRFSPLIWTGTSMLLKLSRRLSLSASSCRALENFPLSQDSPATSCRNGLPSIASADCPMAWANRGETCVIRRDVSVCHSQSAPVSSNSLSNRLTTSLFSLRLASDTFRSMKDRPVIRQAEINRIPIAPDANANSKLPI